MQKERILYCSMNNEFEFVDKQGNITEDIEEAVKYEDLEAAAEERKTFDEPENFKIVKNKIIFKLEEIVDE